MNQFNNLAVGLDWKLDIGSITLTAFQLHVLYHFQGKDNPKQMIFLNQLHFSFRIKSSNVNLCKCHDSILKTLSSQLFQKAALEIESSEIQLNQTIKMQKTVLLLDRFVYFRFIILENQLDFHESIF